MHPDPKDEGPIVIGHKITMILDSNGCDFAFSSLWHFIRKCDIYILQNASAFLLQNVTVITKCDHFITKGDITTKCDIYYKMCKYNR